LLTLHFQVGVHINKENIKEIHLYNRSKRNGMTALVIIGVPIGTDVPTEIRQTPENSIN